MTETEQTSGHDTRHCGAPKRQGEGTCARPAGWGTPHPGIGRCKLHGGSTPSHVASAQAKQAEAIVRKLWDPDAAPVTAPVAAMQKLAGQMTHAVEVLGALLSDPGVCEVCGRGPVDLGSAQGVAWLRQQRELRQLLEAMERLGIAQAQVEIEEARLELIATALGRVFDVLGLSQSQSSEGLRVFFAELRAGGGAVPAALEAGGAS